LDSRSEKPDSIDDHAGDGKAIFISGARVHNLNNIHVTIPRYRITVITGVSGSGKSSLAFDTLYAEGQRRYLESLSTYSRQFLKKMDKPDVDVIDGIPPAIAFEHKPFSKNSRSTVGTATEINDFLRLLYARAGEPFCPECGTKIQPKEPAGIADDILALSMKGYCLILFTLPLSETGGYRILKDRLKERGFRRVLRNKRVIDLDDSSSIPDTPGENKGALHVVVDRVRLEGASPSRLADSVETAMREGEGRVQIMDEDGNLHRYSSHFECPDCGSAFPGLQPALFSFNSPLGACPRCRGFGRIIQIDLKKVVPDPSKSLNEGAIVPWTGKHYSWPLRELSIIAHKYQLDMDMPFSSLSQEHKKLIVNGEEYFPGIKRFFRMLEKKKYKIQVRVFLSRFRTYYTCPECGGQRLKRESLAVRIDGKNIGEINRMSIADAADFFDRLELPSNTREKVTLVLEEITKRLGFLKEVNLEYLTLDRLSHTLSGGEAQRITLASSLGAALSDALYILDEPSIGLHPKDNGRLIHILQQLRKQRNTIVLVEHDPVFITMADHVIDLGPGAGKSGGNVVFEGNPEDLIRCKESLTGHYLGDRKFLSSPADTEETHKNTGYIEIKGSHVHNLKNLNLDIPLGCLICITGVSGSGKSTLLQEVIYNSLKKKNTADPTVSIRSAAGANPIDKVVLVDQSPIGNTPRSNPVTFIRAFSEIRSIFASTPAARERGYGPSHFSFNARTGQCEACGGEGHTRVEMKFFPDLYLTCERCGGTRYKENILEVKYHDRSIRDVLEMSVDEAMGFFSTKRSLCARLNCLKEAGLGYIQLGQPANTLSSGESQRLKLAASMYENTAKKILFLFDEPTTGLHFRDVAQLLRFFKKIITRGNSIIVVEHNLDVIAAADHIIDLGPEGGDRGGWIVAQGRPGEIAENPNSHTGVFLKKYQLQ
jgi:excinuclease ABC subunit A